MRFLMKLGPLMNADTGGLGGAPTPTPTPSPTPAPPDQGGTPAGDPAVTPTAPPSASPIGTQTEYLDFGGIRVPANDPSLHAVHQLYQQQQFQTQQMMQMFQSMQGQQPQATQQPPAPPLGMTEEEFNNLYYENPHAAISKALEHVVQNRVEPFQREYQMQQEIGRVRQQYPDFAQYEQQMAAYIQRNPHAANLPNAIETIYHAVKGQSQPSYTPQHAMQDPSVRDALMNDPQFRSAIIQQYQQEMQARQATPTLIAGAPGGAAPTPPADKPTSMKSAGQMFRNMLQGNTL